PAFRASPRLEAAGARGRAPCRARASRQSRSEEKLERARVMPRIEVAREQEVELERPVGRRGEDVDDPLSLGDRRGALGDRDHVEVAATWVEAPERDGSVHVDADEEVAEDQL